MKTMHIDHIEDVKYVEPNLENPKLRTKFIKRLEKIVRSSMEYKDFIQYVSKFMNMDKCAFFLNMGSNAENGKGNVRVERHHTPLTLYDICNIVLEKYIQNGMEINDLIISQEVIQLHYAGKVGLIPLSKSIHKMVHDTDLIKIPLWLVSDGYIDFLEEYETYWTQIDGIEDKLERAIRESESITNETFKDLVTNFEYVDIKGVSLPDKLQTAQPTKVTDSDIANTDLSKLFVA